MTPAVPVRHQFDALPRFWERSAVFFANLHSLFFGNLEQAAVLESKVEGVSGYGGRLVPVTGILYRGGGNHLVLEAQPDERLADYFQAGLGLEIPGHEVLPRTRYQTIRQWLEFQAGGALAPLRDPQGPAWIDGFVTDATLEWVASATGKSTITTFRGSRDGNDKTALHRHLEESGRERFAGGLAAGPDEVWERLRELRSQGFPRAAVKAAVGASGCGMMVVETHRRDPPPIPAYMFFEGPCLVQGWVQPGESGTAWAWSPSVQLFIGEDEACLYDITEQILSSSSVHEGNLAPPPRLRGDPGLKEALLAASEDAAEWLHARGYRGTASCDFLVFERHKRRHVVLCEINARVTGATYPAILARRFRPDATWIMRNVRTAGAVHSGELLAALDKAGLLFGAGGREGILPINFTAQPDGGGKGQLLCLASGPQRGMALYDEAFAAMPGEWRYDRD